MAPFSCTDPDAAGQRQLLQIARHSIDAGLAGGSASEVDSHSLADPLRAPRGAFVTLTLAQALRGCIGLMEGRDPLAQTVADSAWGAAFRDPRFPQLQASEAPRVRIAISILSPMMPLAVASREQLLDSLRPGVDGLWLEDGARRSTFLPQVWEQRPSAPEFLPQLLLKAGLPADHGSPNLRLQRYYTVDFAEPEQ